MLTTPNGLGVLLRRQPMCPIRPTGSMSSCWSSSLSASPSWPVPLPASSCPRCADGRTPRLPPAPMVGCVFGHAHLHRQCVPPIDSRMGGQRALGAGRVDASPLGRGTRGAISVGESINRPRTSAYSARPASSKRVVSRRPARRSHMESLMNSPAWEPAPRSGCQRRSGLQVAVWSGVSRSRHRYPGS
jgi:hypothetical protein